MGASTMEIRMRFLAAFTLSLIAILAVLQLEDGSDVSLAAADATATTMERSCFARECSISAGTQICENIQQECAPLRMPRGVVLAERHVFQPVSSFHLFTHEMVGPRGVDAFIPQLVDVAMGKIKVSKTKKKNGKKKSSLKIVTGVANGMDKKKLAMIRKKLAPFIRAKKAYIAVVTKASKKYLTPYKKALKKAQAPLLKAQKKYLASMKKAQMKFVKPYNKIVIKAKKHYYKTVAAARKKMGAKQRQQKSSCMTKMCVMTAGGMKCRVLPCKQGRAASRGRRFVRVVHVVPTLKINPRMLRKMRRKIKAFVRRRGGMRRMLRSRKG